MNASSPLLMSTIQLAMKEGRCLLIEDIGTNIDPVLDPVLCKKTFVKVGGWIGVIPTAKRGGRVSHICQNYRAGAAEDCMRPSASPLKFDSGQDETTSMIISTALRQDGLLGQWHGLRGRIQSCDG